MGTDRIANPLDALVTWVNDDLEAAHSARVGKQVVHFAANAEIPKMRYAVRALMIHAVAVEDGNISNAAKRLGIGKTTIYRTLSDFRNRNR